MRVWCDTVLGQVQRSAPMAQCVTGLHEMSWSDLRTRLVAQDLSWARFAADAELSSLSQWLPLIGNTWPALEPGFFLTVESSLGLGLLAESGGTRALLKDYLDR